MGISRRNLFGVGAAMGIAAAIPNVLKAQSRSVSKTMAPVLLERVCDGRITGIMPEEIPDQAKKGSQWYWGCGTRFQWYFGSHCQCPVCFYQYEFTAEMMKSGKFSARTIGEDHGKLERP